MKRKQQKNGKSGVFTHQDVFWYDIALNRPLGGSINPNKDFSDTIRWIEVSEDEKYFIWFLLCSSACGKYARQSFHITAK